MQLGGKVSGAHECRPIAVHFTTAYGADKVGIFERKCVILGSFGSYEVILAGTGRMPRDGKVTQIPLRSQPKNRAGRFILGPKRALALSLRISPDLWHFRDLELIPVARVSGALRRRRDLVRARGLRVLIHHCRREKLDKQPSARLSTPRNTCRGMGSLTQTNTQMGLGLAGAAWSGLHLRFAHGWLVCLRVTDDIGPGRATRPIGGHNPLSPLRGWGESRGDSQV